MTTKKQWLRSPDDSSGTMSNEDKRRVHADLTALAKRGELPAVLVPAETPGAIILTDGEEVP